VAKQRVSEVTGHELAHMWFGNLVTHDFWNLVWLKVQIMEIGLLFNFVIFFLFPELDIAGCSERERVSEESE
jgi:hypothetical protein